MRVLRSRQVSTPSTFPQIKPTKPPSPLPKTLESSSTGILILEPLTPAKSVDTKSSSYTPTQSPGHSGLSTYILGSGLGSDSVVISGTVIRRSSRLASKSSSGEVVGNLVVSSRKRKIISADSGINYSCDSGSGNVGNPGEDMKLANLGKTVSVKRVHRNGRNNDKNYSSDLGSGNAGNPGEDMEVGVGKSVSNLGKMVSVKRECGNGHYKGEFEVSGSGSDDGENGCVNLRSGEGILKGGVKGNAKDRFALSESGNGGKLVCEDERVGKEGEGILRSLDMKELGNGTREEEVCAVGGVRRSSRLEKEKGKGKAFENHVAKVESISEVEVARLSGVTVSGECLSEKMETNGRGVRSKRGFSMEAKGKGKVVEADLSLNHVVNLIAELDLEMKVENSNKSEVPRDGSFKDIGTARRGEEMSAGRRSKRKLSREEKGKGKAVDIDLSLKNAVLLELDLKQSIGTSNDNKVSGTTTVAVDVVSQEGRQVSENSSRANTRASSHMGRFRDIARKIASRFAHFSSQEEDENHVIDEAQREVPLSEMNKEIEDWPGPFSTAMKIIMDRERKVNAQQNSCLGKNDPAHVQWLPRKDQQKHLKRVAPSLQELCMSFLSKNADAITSLDSVPDVLRHKLSQLLCDTRRMDAHFVDLLVSGAPTEIRVKDCSWLSEEQFTTSFERADMTKLTVLQLDQCGRCLPDYTLFSTLAPSSNHLSALTTLSLKGACRLSDSGLSALVFSAPTLKSINLSQCSLLTADSINSLAATLGSVLKELYLDDCESMDPILILPALSKLEQLEVLSLAGIHTVSDDFIFQFVAVCGQNLKKISLANCTDLTDFSLKAIAETCSKLCNIDLSNLRKLTDSAIGYLANGCQGIQTLKLCRNAFSDEAVAAYLETCGESLKELSLNNIKVAHNTAISLAKRSRNLLSLDLSWCRNLTNEALGLIVDSCLSLKVLKLFGCTQITNVFVDGHSNPQVRLIGLKFCPILKHIDAPESLGQSHCSST